MRVGRRRLLATSLTTVPPVQSGSVLLDCHTGDDASSNFVGTLPDAVLVIARRMASASESRSNGKSSSARWSFTTTRLTNESTSGRASCAGTGVTSPTHSDERRGESTGTGSRRRRGRPATSAYVAIMSAYVTTSGPPISSTPAIGSSCSTTATRYRSTSRIEIGWHSVLTHFGVTITGSTSVR